MSLWYLGFQIIMISLKDFVCHVKFQNAHHNSITCINQPSIEEMSKSIEINWNTGCCCQFILRGYCFTDGFRQMIKNVTGWIYKCLVVYPNTGKTNWPLFSIAFILTWLRMILNGSYKYIFLPFSSISR